MVCYLLTSKTMMEKNKKIKQTMDMFLKRVTCPQGEPQAGPTGGAPEGVAITGSDSFRNVIAPEDLPVGREVEVGDADIDDPDPT